MLVVEASAKGTTVSRVATSLQQGDLNMCVVENVRDQKWKAKCAQACVKSDPKEKSTKNRTR